LRAEALKLKTEDKQQLEESTEAAFVAIEDRELAELLNSSIRTAVKSKHARVRKQSSPMSKKTRK
jgi:hypothetical protein